MIIPVHGLKDKKNINTVVKVNSLFENGIVLYVNLNSFHCKMLCARLIKLAQWFCTKQFLKVMKVLSLFLYHLSLKKGMHFICTNLNLLPKSALILEKNFLKLSNYFHYLSMIGCGPSFIKNCIYFAQRCLVQSLDVMGSLVPEKKYFLNVINIFAQYCYVFHLKKIVAFYLNIICP